MGKFRWGTCFIAGAPRRCPFLSDLLSCYPRTSTRSNRDILRAWVKTGNEAEKLIFFERVFTYFYPKAYRRTASLAEYRGNHQISFFSRLFFRSLTRSNRDLLRAWSKTGKEAEKNYLPIPLRVRAILFFFKSTSLISTSITSPTENRSEGRFTNLSDISEMWRSPSW